MRAQGSSPPFHSRTPRAVPTQTHGLPRLLGCVRSVGKYVGAAAPALCFRLCYMHVKRNIMYTQRSQTSRQMPMQNGYNKTEKKRKKKLARSLPPRPPIQKLLIKNREICGHTQPTCHRDTCCLHFVPAVRNSQNTVYLPETAVWEPKGPFREPSAFRY
jgi:hypothetical protein